MAASSPLFFENMTSSMRAGELRQTSSALKAGETITPFTAKAQRARRTSAKEKS
jgi:hypothetical protein